jgi:ABC-type transport system involved in multi-copper enzyme maturation permease subunit
MERRVHSMRAAKIVALLGVVIMGGALIYGFTVGDFSGEGAQLLAMPWGIISLLDVYTMFTLFSVWVVYREKSVVRSAVWVLLIMVLGAFICSLYSLIALQTSGGDWKRFWLGHRRQEQST